MKFVMTECIRFISPIRSSTAGTGVSSEALLRACGFNYNRHPVCFQQERISAYQAYGHLGAKLNQSPRFPTHNRTNVWLINANDAVFNLMAFPLIHVPLLTAQFLDHQQLPVRVIPQ